MTNSKNTAPDWWAVTQAAQGLGINTRRLVALHDADQALEWALGMSRQHSGPTALSYYELAVMLGHKDPKVTAARLDYNELLLAVEKLAGAVKLKAADEKVAAEQAAAEAKAAAEKAAAEKKAAAAAKAAAEEEANAKEAVPDAV